MKKTSILLLLLLLASCASPPPKENSEMERFVESSARGPAAAGCKFMLDQYCSELNSPKAQGNLLIDRQKPILILRGQTPNHFSQTFLKYSVAKIKNQKKLPSDFLEKLHEQSYFYMLDEFIHRMPITRMSLDDRLRTKYLDYQLASIWQSSIEQTILSRMSAKYPGFQQIPENSMPIEYDVEQKRIRRKLISEISKTIWRDDANWKKVTDGFNELKISFLALFDQLDLPTPITNDWKEKIRSLELVLPGAMPEISDEECSTTKANSFYYRYLNVLTVCAGDFNSEDIILTLAHEMSHALDLSRDTYNRLRVSHLGARLADLREMNCTQQEEFSCDKWNDFKQTLAPELAEIQSYRPQLFEFQRCLKKNANTKPIQSADYDRIATQIASARINDLASQNLFLRLIKEKLPLTNGKLQKNPNYMNPCGYYLWSHGEEPIDDEINTAFFFSSEFRCSQGSEPERLGKAIEVAKAMTTEVLKTTLQVEGEFSERYELTSEGFASPPFERFADVMGTYAVAEYLKNINSIWDKRTKFLASTTWLCEDPSIDSSFPEESKIERLYTIESHTQGENRRMEMLSAPIREALSCEKDFTFDECSLPFKK